MNLDALERVIVGHKIANEFVLKNWWLEPQKLPWGNPRDAVGFGLFAVNPQSLQKNVHESGSMMQ